MTPPFFWPRIGGVERYAYQIGKRLALDLEVSVITANDKDSYQVQNIENMKVLKTPSPRNADLREIGLFLRNQLYYLKNEARASDIIITFVPSIYHALASVLVARLRHSKLVTVFFNRDYGSISTNFLLRSFVSQRKTHLMLPWLLGIWTLLSQALIPFILASSNMIILSTPIAFDHEPLLRLFRRKSTVIYAGVSLPEFDIQRDSLNISIGEETTLLLFVSKLTLGHEYKGLDVLLRALAILKSGHLRTKLCVVGEGPLKQTYAKLTSSLGLSLEQDVSFLGYINDEQLARLYSQSDLFVLPSLNENEGLGLVALEAMAAGKPVVTTEVAGVSHYLLQCGGGLVVAPNDPIMLATALKRLVENKKEAELMGLRGREFANKYLGWDVVGKHYLGVISELASQG